MFVAIQNCACLKFKWLACLQYLPQCNERIEKRVITVSTKKKINMSTDYSVT